MDLAEPLATDDDFSQKTESKEETMETNEVDVASKTLKKESEEEKMLKTTDSSKETTLGKHFHLHCAD